MTKRISEDGYTNVATQLGGSRDKSTGTSFMGKPRLAPETLESMYTSDGLASRIVDLLPDEATRDPIILKGTDESIDVKSIMSELDDLQVMTKIGDAWRWSRLFGGAILVPVTSGTGKLDSRLNKEQITKITALHVIESPSLTPASHHPGIGSNSFRDPEFYDVSMMSASDTLKTRRIHRSRVIRFDGVRVPPSQLVKGNGWGPSVLDRVVGELENIGLTLGYAKNILHEISLIVLRLANFRRDLSSGEASEKEVQGYVQNIKDNMDVLGVVALDIADELVVVDRSVTGLSEILEKFESAFLRVTDIPRFKIFNQQPEGLSSSSSGEMESWYNHTATQQQKVVKPAVNTVLECMFSARSHRGEKVPEEWDIDFQPLWEPSNKEKADTYLVRTQADAINIGANIMAPDESRAGHIQRGDIVELEVTPDGSQT
jgi:phage-related protein (TIGR01555 family)